MNDAINSETDGEVAAPTAVSPRFAVVFAGAVVLALIVSLWGLNAFGLASRSVPRPLPDIVVVEDSPALLGAWHDAKIRGAALVSVTRDRQYYPVPEESWMSTSAVGWPMPRVDLQAKITAAAGRQSVVWVGARTGIVRTVIYVLNQPDMIATVDEGRRMGYPGTAPDGKSINSNDNGFIRFVSAGYPKDIPPGAILNIDASYFVNGTPQELMRLIGDSPEKFGLVTMNRARDATNVPEPARARLDEAAQLLWQKVSK